MSDKWQSANIEVSLSVRSAGPVTQCGLLKRGVNSLLAKPQKAKLEKFGVIVAVGSYCFPENPSLPFRCLLSKQILFPQSIRKHKLGF